MKAIWKYPLSLDSRQEILVPLGSKFLCVQVQNNIPTIWIMVNPEAELMGQGFRIIGTGWKLNDAPSGMYLGTFQLDGFVWHLFED